MKTLTEIEILRPKTMPSKSGAIIKYYQLQPHKFGEFFEDQQGLRIYVVDNIPKADPVRRIGIGGSEFHMYSKEILEVFCGGIFWYLEDIGGNKRTLDLSEGDLVYYLPPKTLHQYESKDDGTTLFVQRNVSDIDTYYEDEFRKLQEEHKNLSKKI